MLAQVQKGIKAGQSQDEITKIAELPGFTEHVSSGQGADAGRDVDCGTRN